MFILPVTTTLIMVGLLIFSLMRSRGTSPQFWLIFIFTVRNIMSLVWWLDFEWINQEWLLRCVNAASMSAAVYTIYYMWNLARLPTIPHRHWILSAWIGSFIFIALFTDLFIAASDSEGSIVYGSIRWMLAYIIGASILASICILTVGYNLAKTHAVQIECLFGIFAVVLFGLFVGVLRIAFILELNIVASYFLPIAIAIQLFILVLSYKPVVDVRHHIIGSLERHVFKNIEEVYTAYTVDRIGYSDAIKRIRRELVEYKIAKMEALDSNISHSEIARAMGISRSGLSKILKRDN